MPGHGHFSITISWALLGLLLSASLLNAEPADFPKEARERFDRGRDLQKKGQLREAVIAYDEAIQLGMKDYPRVHLYRAEAVRELKDYDESIAQYTKFIDRFGLERSCRY
jgi:tetratricopeptide (TPR) repeat protein